MEFTADPCPGIPPAQDLRQHLPDRQRRVRARADADGDAERDGDTKTVTTMTIGAADVTAFIGANGPYWTDTNGDHEASPRMRTERRIRSAFAITDLDVGIALMVSTDPDRPRRLSRRQAQRATDFGLVGIDGLTATGTFDVELNVGIGLSGLDLDLQAIDFPPASARRLRCSTCWTPTTTGTSTRTSRSQRSPAAIPASASRRQRNWLRC